MFEEKHVKAVAIFQGGGCCASKPTPANPLAAYAGAVEGGSACGDGNAEPATPTTSCCSSPTDAAGSEDTSFKARMRRTMASAVDTFKRVFWYLMLGAVVGAFIYGFFPRDLVEHVAGPGNPWSVPIDAVLGVPMYIRAETVIPIGAALICKGMGVATILALVVAGAEASIPEVIILSSIFK